MSKILWDALKLGSAVLGASLVFANSASAGEQTAQPQAAPNTLEQINLYNNPGSAVDPTTEDPMGQITNISQLTDVKPSDWAYQSLRDLVERYGCISGYPDSLFRGNRSLSRYEFAAGVNSCLKQIETLLGDTSKAATREDLEAVKKLVEEFQVELAALNTRVDNLESRTEFLEKHQFSTTTKLNAEVIVAVSDVVGGTRRAVTSGSATGSRGNLGIEPFMSNRVRLNFDTSFTGKDLLRTRLQSRSTVSFTRTGTAGAAGDTGTRMTRLGFDGSESNDTFLSKLDYRFPLTSQTTAYFTPIGAEYNDQLINFNSLLAGAAEGSVSRFGRFSPIYRQGDAGGGLTLVHNFSKELNLSLGYLGLPATSANPVTNAGLFNGGYAALAQIAFKPSDAFNIGLTYVNSYNNATSGLRLSGDTGSLWANAPFGTTTPTTGNHYGLETSFRVSPSFVLAGWAGYTTAIAERGGTGFSRGSSAEIWNWAVTLGLPDLGKKGNLLGLVFGQPPRAGGNALATNRDKDTSYHIEGFYRFQISDNIAITPGLFVILNPEHNAANDTLWVGVLRTTFKF
jgi:hypothetical protein